MLPSPPTSTFSPFFDKRFQYQVQIRKTASNQRHQQRIQTFMQACDSRHLIQTLRKENPSTDKIIEYMRRSSRTTLLEQKQEIQRLFSKNVHSVETLNALRILSNKTSKVNEKIFENVIGYFYERYVVAPDQQEKCMIQNSDGVLERGNTQTPSKITQKENKEEEEDTVDIANSFLSYIAAATDHLRITQSHPLFPLLNQCDKILIRWWGASIPLNPQIISNYILQGLLYGRETIEQNVVYIIDILLKQSTSLPSTLAHLILRLLTSKQYLQQKYMLLQLPHLLPKLIKYLPEYVSLLLAILKDPELLARLITLNHLPTVLQKLQTIISEPSFQWNEKLEVFAWVEHTVVKHPEMVQIIIDQRGFLKTLIKCNMGRVCNCLVALLWCPNLGQFEVLEKEYGVMGVLVEECKRGNGDLLEVMVGLYIEWYEKMTDEEGNGRYRVIFKGDEMEQLILMAEDKECEEALEMLRNLKQEIEELEEEESEKREVKEKQREVKGVGKQNRDNNKKQEENHGAEKQNISIGK